MSSDRPIIGIDVTSAIAQGGGIGRYTRELIQALARSDATTPYRLFSARPPAVTPVANPLPQAANMRHRPAPLDERWLYRLWYRARLPLPVQWVTGRIDLFHSPDFVLPPVAGRIPTLLTVHDLSFIRYPDVYPEALVRYLNRVVPWSVRRATHIVADSAETQRDLTALWGVPEEKISVLYAGVGAEFQPVTNRRTLTAVREKYGLGDKPYLLSVGTVQPRKNYQMLIRAYAAVATNWPHRLAIAGGKGWLYDAILEEIAAQGLQERVLMLGFVDDADLPALYSDAALFLFPSLYEGFGLPVLEAMACGAPCIVSDASCLPEVVGDAGVLLSPHDEAGWARAIHRLLLDAPQRARLVGRGALQAHRFTWTEAARTLRALYERLLAGTNA